jgi:predicted nuclease with TOPRIM domain
MSIIEQKIKKNASLFNSREPSEKHLENFQSKLKALHPEKAKKSFKLNINYNALKFAASIAILVSLSLVLFRYGNFGKQVQASDLGSEYMEMQDYYASVNQDKFEQIDMLIGNDQDAQVLKEKAFRKIAKLEENSESLKSEYIESNKDDRVFGAVVSNYKLLTKALDKVIDGLNDHNYKKSNSQ